MNKKDPHTNPMGSKGIGEIGLIGTAPAIANAVFSATAKTHPVISDYQIN